MEIWLDTADRSEIERAKEMGLLHGVTTNPSIVAKSKRGLEELLEELLKIQEGPVTAQVTAFDSEAMIKQGQALYDFSNRIYVKVPVNPEGLRTIHALSKRQIPVMATAVFNPSQVLLAARAGAQYIAPYFSKICDADRDGIEQLKAMLRLLSRYQFSSKLIAASLRSGEQVNECAEIGAHAATLNPEVFASFVESPAETVQCLQKFEKDWKTAKACRILPL